MPRQMRTATLLSAVFVASAVLPARAQGALDRVIGPSTQGAPLIITTLTGTTLGAMATASGVPMGFEAVAPAIPHPLRVRATGMTLRAALEAITAADPRYEWREDDGVVVVRPVAAWSDPAHLLHSEVDALKRDNIQSRDAFDLLAHMMGLQTVPGTGPGDTRPFSVDLPAGTALTILNGLVRAHGHMTWAWEPYLQSFPFKMSLGVGRGGPGFGVPADALLRPHWPEPIPASRDREDHVPLLARAVGKMPNGQPVVWGGTYPTFVTTLAEAAGVPMGIEQLAWDKLPESERILIHFESITLTGMSLGAALSAITAADPRQEWREMDGVIVFRPASAWADPADPLYGLVGRVKLDRVTTTAAIVAAVTPFDPALRSLNVVDRRRVSVDLPNGTHLDLWNALVRSHGAMSWTFEHLSAGQRKPIPGRRYRLTFWIFGAGVSEGFDLP